MKFSLIFVVCWFAFKLAAEIIPYSPGTVITSRESLKDWQVKAVTEKSAATWHYHATALRHYAKDTTGKFEFSKDLGNINCDDFDRFIYDPLIGEFKENPKQVITGFLDTDCGIIKSLPVKTVKVGDKTFYSPCVVFDVSKAKTIKSVRFEITLTKKGIADGALCRGMFLLRNTTERNIYMKHYRRFADLKWEGLIQKENYKPKFKLQYEILFSNADLEKYRKLYGKYIGGIALDKLPAPETAISKNIGSNYRTADNAELYLKYLKSQRRYYMRSNAAGLAFRGIIRKDRKMMRMAARYILSTATFDAWNDNPRRDTVGHYQWPAFTPNYNLYGLAVGLDCAGEMLTKRGREYVLKAMVLKGIGPITYSLWQRHYAFNMNQGFSFLRGKVLALCVMDQVWPRVSPMLETSKNESDECMSRLFRPDGSYMESVGYLAYAVGCAIPIYEAYSLWKKKPMPEVIPSYMKNFGLYAEVIASTCIDHKQAIIPLGQCVTWFNIETLSSAFLAVGCPDSMWVNLYRKIPQATKAVYFKNPGLCKGIRAMRLCSLADKLSGAKKLQDFILLKTCGLTSSLRELNGKKVKILVVGDAAGVGKKAYDTSSFILEFAGDSFAMPIPVMSGLFYESQYRNMTVPILENDTFATQKYLLGHRPQSDRNSQLPVASGDAKSFKCKINADLSWDRKYFKNYTRTIDSPSPENIIITDKYKIGRKAKGAAFIMITYLPVEIKDNKAIIRGNHGGRAILSASDGCKITVEQFTPGARSLKGMAMKKGSKLNRLIISKYGKRGTKDKIVVNIKLMTI